MTNKNALPPTPVDGVVFGRSPLKTLGLILLTLLLFLFGLFLIWAKITDQVVLAGKQVTWWGLLIGIGAVVFAPFLIGGLLRALWRKRRLVVGSDRLQVLERRGEEDKVVLQIPYANIAEFKYEVTDTERRVGIDLHQLDDPETYPGREDFVVNNSVDGRHYCISAGYRGGPRAIATALERAYEKWAAS